MRRLLLFVSIVSNSVFGTETEKEVKSKIAKATIFLNGVEVPRESNLSLSKGKAV